MATHGETPHGGTAPGGHNEPPHPPRPSLNILSLDDDADFREYITSVLETDGHTVRTAATAAEFFALAQARLPDVVLLDMNMGAESGESVLDDIRRRWPRLCVVVVTGYPTLESMRRALRRDAGGTEAGSGGGGGGGSGLR
ncbi:MAG TPA: response regulator, partial [Phycisphaerales bacterium]|nr:response regulator [Phycisphaerales bacterium]